MLTNIALWFFIVGVGVGSFYILVNLFYKNKRKETRKESSPKNIEVIKDGNRILYYVKIISHNEVAYKIGITTQNVYRRFKRDIEDGVRIIELAHQLYQTGEQAYVVEQKLHNSYRKDVRWRTKGHMLRSGNSELYWKDILGLDKR